MNTATFTVRNEVTKVMFLHLSVILSTGGVCLSVWWDTTPLGPGTPTYQAAPKTRHSPKDKAPLQDQAYPPTGVQTATAADGTHPTGMHSCFLLCCIGFVSIKLLFFLSKTVGRQSGYIPSIKL